MNPNEPPRPPLPSPGKSNFSGLKSNQISIPELDRKEAARKKAEIEAQQKANPQTPDSEGLNSSGLPSAQAYYKGGKEQPLHTSVITPIIESRKWLKILAIGALVLGFFWVKDAITLFGLPGFGGKVQGFLQLTLSFFFFVKPAHKLWLLHQDLDGLELERDQRSLSLALYTHSELWKYGGRAVIGASLYCLCMWILPMLGKMLSLN